MKNDNLAVYLNDHLAGSTGALELVDHMIKATEGTAFEKFFKELCEEIQKDQDTLKELMSDLGIQQSTLRKASAWFLEKAGMIKLGPDLTKDNHFGLFQALEGLELGIKGKKKLWQALEQITEPASILQRFDFSHLQKKADEQYAKVEEKRLAMAREALG